MKKMCIALILIIFIIISGCEKNSNKGDKSSEYISQNISEQATKDVMNISQELEYSAEKADAILEKMGMKSYDIWKWLRPEKGEETEKFLNQEFDEWMSHINPEYLEEKQQNREQEIEEARKSIYGRYKVEQETPIIIKINCKDENKKYMTEERFGERAYSYLSKNGFLVKDGDKWYEICGYGNYWKNMLDLGSNYWVYDVEPLVEVEYHAYGFDKMDGKTYNEERVRKMCIPNVYVEEKFEEGTCTYACENLTVNVYYRLYDEREVLDRGKQRAAYICFYIMLDEYKAVTCNLSAVLDSTGYYSEITEEKLREIFTVREYK